MLDPEVNDWQKVRKDGDLISHFVHHWSPSFRDPRHDARLFPLASCLWRVTEEAQKNPFEGLLFLLLPWANAHMLPAPFGSLPQASKWGAGAQNEGSGSG